MIFKRMKFITLRHFKNEKKKKWRVNKNMNDWFSYTFFSKNKNKIKNLY